jgi:cell division protein FtsI/penicillin-binding protein 2
MKNFGAFKPLQMVVAFVLVVGVLSVFTYQKIQLSLGSYLKKESSLVFTKDQVAEAMANTAMNRQLPSELDFQRRNSQSIRLQVNYTVDLKLQKTMEELFRSYSPDYGAFVALDAETGKVLSMVSYSRAKLTKDHLALRASFPSASVFKVVTAAAALESEKIGPDTVIPFNGRSHTLYRGQILKSDITRWTHFITFKEAFAKSINTVFGKVGAFTVGSTGMRLYADRFGFNGKISADMPIQEGKALIPTDPWGLAEASSGFTTENTMSPLQGALIAAAVANDGVMMEPFVVQSMYKEDGSLVYLGEQKVARIAMKSSTAHEIRTLMKETVLRGTSKNSFRGFFRSKLAFVDVGGKTGSLTGYDPKGKYDWFVGFADSKNHKIAIAALTIHEKEWRVKSSYLARRAIESYYKEAVDLKNVAQR